MGHDRGGGGVVLRDELPEPLEKLVVREMRQRVAVHGGSPRPSTVAGAGSKPTTTHRQGPEPFSRTTLPRAAGPRSLSLGPPCHERRDLGAFLSDHPANSGAPSEPFPRTTLPRAARLRSLSPGPPCQERRDLGAFPPNHPAVKRRGSVKMAVGPLAGS